MIPLSPGELADFRETQTDAMMDSCVLCPRVRTENTKGEQVDTWPDPSPAVEIVCGLDMRPGSEVERQTMVVTNWDATLRMPIDTTVDQTYRIKITKRFSESITAIYFEAAGPVQRGPSGIRIRLKKVAL